MHSNLGALNPDICLNIYLNIYLLRECYNELGISSGLALPSTRWMTFGLQFYHLYNIDCSEDQKKKTFVKLFCNLCIDTWTLFYKVNRNPFSPNPISNWLVASRPCLPLLWHFSDPTSSAHCFSAHTFSSMVPILCILVALLSGRGMWGKWEDVRVSLCWSVAECLIYTHHNPVK